MVNLRGDNVVLRAVEPADIDFMYGVENDLENWGVSGTTLPFSQYLLSRFVESQSEELCVTKQLRLVVTQLDGECVGMVDLFDYDVFNHRAGVGIFIAEPFRGLGFASAALEVVHRYAREVLQLHQIWCGVESDNVASLRLFDRLNYEVVGTKRDWLRRADEYCDEVMLQRMLLRV